jgi:predicted transcriptional regulator
MTKDLVKSQIEHRHISPESLHQALQDTYTTLLSLKVQEDRLESGDVGYAQEVSETPDFVNWKKSITKHAITCLECGQSFKQLSRRHLSQHSLDGRLYRLKYGMPRTQPLSAKATTAKRREVAQAIKPWEQTPRALRAKEEQAKAAKKTVKRTRKQAKKMEES